MLDFKSLYESSPLVFYGMLVQGHKALGHQVYDTFWQTHCRTCGWSANLWVNGDAFNPNILAKWTVTTT